MDRRNSIDRQSFKPFGTFSTNSFNIRATSNTSKPTNPLSNKATPNSKTENPHLISRESHIPLILSAKTDRSSLNGYGNNFCSKIGLKKPSSASVNKRDYMLKDQQYLTKLSELLTTPNNNKKRLSSELFYSKSEVKEEKILDEETEIHFESGNNHAVQEDRSANEEEMKEIQMQKTLAQIEKGIGETELVKVRMCFMNVLAKSKSIKNLSRFLRQRGATPTEMMIYNDLYSNDMTLPDMKTPILLNPENLHTMVSTSIREVRKDLGLKKSLMRRGSKIMLIQKETPIIDGGNQSDYSNEDDDCSMMSISSVVRCNCSGKYKIQNPTKTEEELCYNSIPRKISKFKKELIENLVKGTTSYLIEEYSDLAMRKIYVFFVRRTRTWGFYFIPKICENLWDLYVPILLEKEDGGIMEFTLNPRNELSEGSHELLTEYQRQTQIVVDKEKEAKEKEIEDLKEKIAANEKEWNRGYGILSIIQPIDYMENLFQRYSMSLKLKKLMIR